MSFTGWQAEALEFYEGLEADNTKAYWTEHKQDYEILVYQPMVELLTELSDAYGDWKIYRPYRDVRFSADKTPYKTAMGASLAQGGYVQLSAKGLGAGCGMWMMAPDQLDRYRKAVDAESSGAGLVELVAAGAKAGLEVTGHDVLKTAPRGYPKDHPRIDLLRNKGLISWRDWIPGPWLATAAAKKRLVEFFEASKPMSEWLERHVGGSELEPPAR